MLIPLSYLPFSIHFTSRKVFLQSHIPQNSQDYSLWYLCVFTCIQRLISHFLPQLEVSNLKEHEKKSIPQNRTRAWLAVFGLFGHCTAALCSGSFPAEDPTDILARVEEVLPSQPTKCGQFCVIAVLMEALSPLPCTHLFSM